MVLADDDLDSHAELIAAAEDFDHAPAGARAAAGLGEFADLDVHNQAVQLAGARAGTGGRAAPALGLAAELAVAPGGALPAGGPLLAWRGGGFKRQAGLERQDGIRALAAAGFAGYRPLRGLKDARTEERPVGEEGRSRWAPDHLKK